MPRARGVVNMTSHMFWKKNDCDIVPARRSNRARTYEAKHLPIVDIKDRAAGARCHANAWLPVCRQPWVHTSSGTSLLVVPRAVEEILSSMQTDRIFDIADVPFAQVPEDEKKRYAGDIKQTGSYRGYKLRNYWVSIRLLACRILQTETVSY